MFLAPGAADVEPCDGAMANEPKALPDEHPALNASTPAATAARMILRMVPPLRARTHARVECALCQARIMGALPRFGACR